jgi:hypothetical protein
MCRRHLEVGSPLFFSRDGRATQVGGECDLTHDTPPCGDGISPSQNPREEAFI